MAGGRRPKQPSSVSGDVAASDREVLLPREIMDLIVKDMDKECLAVCSLASSYWSASARPMLFRSIILHDHRDELNWLPNEADCCDPNYNFDSFRRFIYSENSSCQEILPWIQDLTMKGEEFDSASCNLTLWELDLILFRLPALQILKLNRITLLHALPGAILRGWSSPKSLKTLQLQDVEMHRKPLEVPVDDARGASTPASCCFAEFLNLFREVGTLHLIDVSFTDPSITALGINGTYGDYWDNVAFTQDAAAQVSCRLRMGTVVAGFGRWSDQWTNAEVWGILRFSRSLAGLTTLEIADVERVVRKVLKTVGSSLVRLHLTLDPVPLDPDDYDREDMYNMACCTKLRSLQITILMNTNETTGYASNHLEDMLKHCHQTVESLVLEFDYDNMNTEPESQNLNLVKWGIIDRLLHAWPALTGVKIVFKAKPEMDKSEDEEQPEFAPFHAEVRLVRAKMKRLVRTNFLSFAVEQEYVPQAPEEEDAEEEEDEEEEDEEEEEED